MQLGILLWSFDLCRNNCRTVLYEYADRFASIVLQAATATPQRHSARGIMNHNQVETYMVEAWFLPSDLARRRKLATFESLSDSHYTFLYAGETYLHCRMPPLVP